MQAGAFGKGQVEKGSFEKGQGAAGAGAEGAAAADGDQESVDCPGWQGKRSYRTRDLLYSNIHEENSRVSLTKVTVSTDLRIKVNVN